MKKILAAVLVIALLFGVTAQASIQTQAGVGKVKGIRVVSKAKYGAKKANITISWKKVKSASKYAVYRATSKNGKYKKVKTVKKTNFVDKKKKGVFFYKVKALKGKSVGKFSAKKSTYTATGKVAYVMTLNMMGMIIARNHQILIDNLGKKDIFILKDKDVNNKIYCEQNKKKIKKTLTGSILNGKEKEPFKVTKKDNMVGLRTSAATSSNSDIYAQLTFRNKKSSGTKYMLWVSFKDGTSYVEEGSKLKNSKIFN